MPEHKQAFSRMQASGLLPTALHSHFVQASIRGTAHRDVRSKTFTSAAPSLDRSKARICG